MGKIGNRIRVTVAACGLALLLGAPARAADASPWVEDNYSGIRLIAGANKSGAESLSAGIEIKMQAGWHTYWRYPGDSGVPPRFSFAGSDNLASATVLFPAPHAFTDEAGTTIGYKGNVILPVSVVPRQKDKPVTLRAKIDYAVCEKLCVPAEARLELTLDPTSGADNAALAAAEIEEKLGIKEDRLARLMEALDVIRDRAENVRLVRVMSGEDPPPGAKKQGDFYYLVDLLPRPEQRRDRDGRGDRGGGQGRRDRGGGGSGGGPGGAGGGRGGGRTQRTRRLGGSALPRATQHVGDLVDSLGAEHHELVVDEYRRHAGDAELLRGALVGAHVHRKRVGRPE